VFVAGTFTSIRNNTATNTTSYAQPYLASFNIDTGLVDTTFRPTFGGGGVTEIAASPDGTKLFVVGRFNTVNGVTKRKVASLNPVTGAVNTGFTANANSAATAVAASNTTVYIGGLFTAINNTPRVSLAAVNSTTGAVVTGFVNNLSGGIGVNGELSVQALVLTHDNSKLLVVHTGRQINGQDRYGIGLIDTATNQLLPWRTRLWDDNLQFVGGVTRIYAGAIAPNDQYFVVSSGSGGDRPPISDVAVAYPMSGGDNVEPLWISRAFDSVYSVAISEVAVYIGGHFQWNESPTADDPWPGLTDAGYGTGQGLSAYGLGDQVVRRDHIGALDPATGKALEFDPGSNSFEGNKAMLVTPRGLVAGGDATTQGGANVGRVAFYDFNSIPAVGQDETTITDPIEGRVEPADQEWVIDGTATATSGVNRVQLQVNDRDSGQYLQDNLTSWGGFNTINVNLASPNATSTTWSLPLTLSGNRRIMLRAQTFATNGTSDSSMAIKRIETFGLADATPTTNVTGPNGSVIPTTTFTVTGTAQDDVGVNSISWSIRDAQFRYLQDDGSTSTTFNTFRVLPDVIGATSATWSDEVTVPYEGTWTFQATAVDTAGQSDLRSAAVTWIVSATAIPPTVTIATPAVMTPPTAIAPLTMAPGSPVTFSGTATDDEGLADVTITLRNSVTRENLASDGTWGVGLVAGSYRISPVNIGGLTYNWSYTTPFNLRPGTYSFSVSASDDLGLNTSSANRGSLTINVQVPGDAFPDGRLNITGTQPNLQVLHLDLAGTATDDIGVSAVRLTIQDQDTSRYLQPNGTMAAGYALVDAVLANPGATTTTWTLPVTLPTQGTFSVTAFAYDTSGQQDPSTSGATATYPAYPGDLPPTFVAGLFSPPDGTAFTDGRIVVSGRVEDDQQIAQAQVAIRNGLGQYMSSSGGFTSTTVSYRTAFLNSPGSLGSNFSYTTPVIPPGAYTVFARGVDQHGFTTTVPMQVNVTVSGTVTSLPPVANFTSSCVQNVCTFDGRTSTDENPPTLTYSWNFGQGSGSGPVPTRTYTSAGTFTVTLTVRDENGLSGVTSQTVTIAEPAGNLPPVPVINAPSCAARVCNISGVGSADPNVGDTFTYLWNFGDGSATSTSSSSSHTFLADGTYTVTLTTTDGWGKAASTTRTITIAKPGTNLPPIPVISAPVCLARACNFFGSGSSDPNGDTFTYLWNWGDNTATGTGVTPSHTYAVDGVYTVTLAVTDAWGDSASTTRVVTIAKPGTNAPPVPVIGAPSCIARVCSMSSAGSVDPNGDPFTYLWNFGDGTATSTASAPSHTFPANGPYTVTLTLTDGWGDAANTTRVVSFTEPPTNVAPIPVIDSPVCTARACTLSAATSSDPDGDTFTYLWNFGDLATSTSASPTHTYVADGTYTVTLTLTDAWGKAASTTRVVTIAKPGTNLPPVPVINPVVCAARACTIYGVSSSDPNSDTFTYLWNFGDGTATATAATNTHTYAVDGTYTVTLTTTDAWGDAASTTRVVTIAKPVTNVPPVPVMGVPSCGGRVCAFSGAGSSDPNGDAFTYSWNWGDATTAGTGVNPAAHTYAVAGTYTVTLTVTDAWGDSASTTRVVTVA
jgi:PKD repeat protein